jgi:hypothetical protein
MDWPPGQWFPSVSAAFLPVFTVNFSVRKLFFNIVFHFNLLTFVILYNALEKSFNTHVLCNCSKYIIYKCMEFLWRLHGRSP